MRIPELVSPDDHVITPPHVWESRLPARYRDAGPRVVRARGTARLSEGWIDFQETDDGDECDVWLYENVRRPTLQMTVSAGLPKGTATARPVTFDEMRKGCYDPAARLADMDIAGIEASVCFPNMFVRFCGQTFLYSTDKDLALLCVQAYNDYIVDEWCAGSDGRLVPLGIVPLWDPTLAAEEVERCAERGFRAVTFSEAPHLLGLPSIFSGHWEPFFAAVEAADMVLCLHIGSGGFPMIAADAPGAIQNVVPAMNSAHSLVDLLFSGVLHRYPRLRVSLAESQIGWLPYILQRADAVWEELGGFTGVTANVLPEPPSHYFHRQVWCTFFKDQVGLGMIDLIGVDRVLYETDYPHNDTSWPDCRTVAEDLTLALTVEDAAKVVSGNAKKLFRIDRTPR